MCARFIVFCGKQFVIHFVPYPDGYIFDDALTVQLTPTEQQFGITFNVFGKSHAAIKAAKSAVMELCDDESNVVVLDTDQDKVAIAKLTASEVNIYRVSQGRSLSVFCCPSTI